MAFVKAERRRAKARILIEGPSGSGKSYSALLLAKGLGGKIAAIDTEHGSLSMYDNIADFDVMELGAPFSPRRYIQAIKEAEEAGYDVLIIDSITHEWTGEGGCLDILEKTPAPGGNSWGRWATVTPQHNAFIEAMLQSGCHIIATTRSKTEYALAENDKGKQAPKKLGTAPQQRDGIDYEFTMVFTVQTDSHVASVTKDRTGQFDGFLEKISEKTGQGIAKWLGSGAEPAPKPEPDPEPDPLPEAVDPAEALKPLREQCRMKAKKLELPGEAFLALIKGVHASGKLVECSEEELRELLKRLNAAAKGAEKAATQEAA